MSSYSVKFNKNVPLRSNALLIILSNIYYNVENVVLLFVYLVEYYCRTLKLLQNDIFT